MTIDPHELGKELRRLKKEDPEHLKRVISQMSEQEALALAYDWDVWARPNQRYDIRKAPKITFWQAGRGYGKDLAFSTPILTKNKGWVSMGDIEIGDIVYAWDGTPTSVLDCYEPEPRQLVELTFSDGEKIISSVEHDWVTLDRSARRAISRYFEDSTFPDDWVNWVHTGKDRWGNVRGKASAGKRTTQEIIDTFRDSSTRADLNHSIPLCKPLQGEYDESITDPYYLGMWLGDGSSASGHLMACGREDEWWLLENWPDFKRIGNCLYRRPAGCVPFLYEFGLRNNKHIPQCVFSSSFEQRLSVLQGLMDSDGYAERSVVEFVSIKEGLANDVMELARGLGQKPVLSTGDATLNGRFISKKYRVTWRPVQNINPFRLPRKAEKVKFGGNQEMRNYQRMITSWKYVDYEPTKCISVDHKDHLFLAGKSLIATHNTRTGAEAIRHAVEQGCKRIALIAPTAGDARDVMVLGESGILSVFPPHQKPDYQPSYARVVFHTGAEAKLFSAEEPLRLRGPQHDVVWMDEPASINNRDMFDQMLIGCRIGFAKVIVTGTPMVNDIVLELHKRRDKDVEIRFGSTLENEANLAEDYVDTIYDMYKGTRYEKQELEGQLVLSNPGALWSYETIDRQTLPKGDRPPRLEKVTIAIDPATSAGKNSDNTGIVVCGLGEDGNGYVLGDYTDKYTTDGWTDKVIRLYDSYANDCPVKVVIERNQGGSMVVEALTRVRPLLPVEDVFSTRSKIARASPISLLYEKGMVFHVHGLGDLEQEMVSYEGRKGQKSPDRMDACVFALTALMPSKNRLVKGFEFLV